MGDRLLAGAFAAAVVGAYSIYRACSGNNNLRVISNVAECRQAIRAIRSHCRDYTVVGFDCEWANWGGRQPVALLQLKTYQGLCVLIRLQYIGMIKELKELLEDERILKVGVGVDHDIKALYDDHRISVKGTLDLQYMAALANCRPGKLSRMSEDYLNLRLNKEYMPYSDWDAADLSQEQIDYAAQDVYAAIALFKYFVEKIYDGWMPRTDKARVDYVIGRFCRKFVDLYYNGAQGIPLDLIRRRLAN